MSRTETTDAELTDVLSTWLTEALTAVENNLSELVQLINLPKWHTEPDGSFVKYPYTAFYRYSELDQLLFVDSKTWLEVVRVATLHTNFMKHTDHLIGSVYGMRRTYSFQELCKLLLPIPTVVEGSKIYVDTEQNVTEKVTAFVTEINTVTTRTKTFWPIVGISTNTLVQLDQYTQFRELTVEEKLTCLQIEIIKPHMQDRVDLASSKWFGLCRYTDSPKIFEETPFDGDGFTRHVNEKDQVLEDFLSIIPVVGERIAFHAGGFHSAPTFETGGVFAGGMMSYTGSTSSMRFLFFDEASLLSDAQKTELLTLWSFIRGGGGSAYKKQIVNAMRRLFYAETRTRPEDKLVDCMIVSESLYLGDGNKNDLSFRASLNASLWSEVTPIERSIIFKQFKKAYSLRSSIVHGSAVRIEEVREITEQIKPVLRTAIRKALQHENTTSTAPDWDSMIFN